MFTIIIQEKGGEQRRMVFNKPEVTIGRVQGNDIVLPKGNVSKRHARIVLKDSKFIIVDLKSTNGTYVNGRKITSPLVVKDSDKIYVGDFIIGVDEAASAEGDNQSETTTAPPERMAAPPPDNRPPRATEASPVIPSMVPGMNGGGEPMGRGNGMPPMGPMGGPPMGPGMNMRGGGDDAPPAPAPSPGPSTLRPGPPRQPPAPMGARGAPDGARPPMGGPMGGGGDMPPIAPPERRPLGGRPGGTMPPPIAPLPSMAPPMPMPMPMSPAPQPTSLEPHHAPAPMPPPQMVSPLPAPSPQPVAPIAPSPVNYAGSPPAQQPMAQQPSNQGAVVPIAGQAKARQLHGVAAKKIVVRSVSMPSRRGVHLDPLDPKVVKMLDLQSNILERLRAKLDLDKVPMDRLHEEDLWQKAERATIDLVETLETSGELPKYIDQDTLIKETLNEALALGPLEDLLADEKIDEILIDRRDRVVVGKEGVLRGSGKAFSSDDVFERVVKRLVAEAGAKIDDANPLVDLRMRDGTRLTAAVSPVAARGACLVLKKAATHMPPLADLVGAGALSPGMANFLATCVTARRNVLVCGSPSSGKTTLVGALALAAPPGERVISIETVAELSLARDEWIQLETRASNAKHTAIELGHLLDTALRLQPDRLVVGEVRGHEALPLVHALCANVDGATVAMSGEGSAAALGRLATLARSATEGGLGDQAIRELCAQAFEIVVHVMRWADGTLRVAAIEEVLGCSETGFDTQVLFQWRDNGFHAMGTVPRFYAELEAKGITADQAIFR